MNHCDDHETQVPEGGATPPLGPPLGPQLSPSLRHYYSRRAVWHSAGILVALAFAWLIFRAYRQPDFLIDLANMQLC